MANVSFILAPLRSPPFRDVPGTSNFTSQFTREQKPHAGVERSGTPRSAAPAIPVRGAGGNADRKAWRDLPGWWVLRYAHGEVRRQQMLTLSDHSRRTLAKL